MKELTIWARLNLAVVSLILLLSFGFGLYFWTEKARWTADKRSIELTDYKDKIHFDIVSLSESVRGLLLDPKNESEKKRWREAQTDMEANIGTIQAAFPEYQDLTNSLKSLREFHLKTISPFQARLLEIVDTNQPAALEEYSRGYRDLHDRREKLFADLSQQFENVKTSEHERAQKAAVWGTA